MDEVVLGGVGERILPRAGGGVVGSPPKKCGPPRLVGPIRDRPHRRVDGSTSLPLVLLDGAAALFAEGGGKPARAADQPDPAELFEQIGRLKMELEWMKKNNDPVES